MYSTYVHNPVAEGGERIYGSITVPMDFKVGGFIMFAVTDDAKCRWAAQTVGASYMDTVPPVRIDWSVAVPVFWDVPSVECEFVAAIEVLDVRPTGFGGENMPPLNLFIPDESDKSQSIRVTFLQPGAGIGQ